VARVTDEAEASRLLAAGGRLLRHSHEMVLDLGGASPPEPSALPAGLSLVPLERPAAEIAAAAATATPPGHVDHSTWSLVDRAAYWTRLMAGDVTGPVLAEPSGLVVGPGRGIVAGLVVTLLESRSEWWPGGPWIPELFVVPALQGRGVGGLLLARAARSCRDAGHRLVGLTVTEGNRARRLYERFGFREARTHWTIER
jgi:GNAT superfamily N-acetyltransferase